MASGVFVEVNMEEAQHVGEGAFTVENVVRKQNTRLLRSTSATRHRFKQFIAGKRLLRGKKVALTDAEFEGNLQHILEVLDAGIVAVHTPSGIRITTTFDGRYILRKRSGAIKVADVDEVRALLFRDDADPSAENQKEESEELEEPDGELEEPDGELEEPDEVPEDSEEEPEEEELDDLTEIPGIGAGRAKKLVAFGVSSFQDLADMPVDDLVSVVNVDKDTATSMVNSALDLLED